MLGKEKIGVGMITCNRLPLFRESVAGLPDVDMIVVVNDGDSYPASSYPSRVAEVIQHRTNRGVGRSKNDALRKLLEAGCSHIFLCEDDVKIVNPQICQEYVRASQRSGILHFNFAYAGPENRSAGGQPVPRKIVDYGLGVSVSLNRRLAGAFSYFRDDVLRTCGFLHPFYKNMHEHIDHTYKIIRRGYHPPFWWFADVAESFRSFEDLDPDLSRTTRRRDRLFMLSLRLHDAYFFLRNGRYIENLPDVGETKVEQVLAEIQKKYGRNVNVKANGSDHGGS